MMWLKLTLWLQLIPLNACRFFHFLAFQSFSIPAQVWSLDLNNFLPFSFFLSFWGYPVASVGFWLMCKHWFPWMGLTWKHLKSVEISLFVVGWMGKYDMFCFSIWFYEIDWIKCANAKDFEKRHMIDPTSMYVYVRVAISKKIDVRARLIVFFVEESMIKSDFVTIMREETLFRESIINQNDKAAYLITDYSNWLAIFNKLAEKYLQDYETKNQVRVLQYLLA